MPCFGSMKWSISSSSMWTCVCMRACMCLYVVIIRRDHTQIWHAAHLSLQRKGNNSTDRSKLSWMFCIFLFCSIPLSLLHLPPILLLCKGNTEQKHASIVQHWFTVTVDDGCNQKHIWSPNALIASALPKRTKSRASQLLFSWKWTGYITFKLDFDWMMSQRK